MMLVLNPLDCSGSCSTYMCYCCCVYLFLLFVLTLQPGRCLPLLGITPEEVRRIVGTAVVCVL